MGVVARLPLLVDVLVLDAVRRDRPGRRERVEVAAERHDVVDFVRDARVGGRDERQRAADAGAEEADAVGIHLREALHILELGDKRVDLLGLDAEFVEAVAERHQHHHAGAGGVLRDADEARIVERQRRRAHREDHASMDTALSGKVEVGFDGARAVAALVVDRHALARWRVGDQVHGTKRQRHLQHHVRQEDRGFDGDASVAVAAQQHRHDGEQRERPQQRPGADEKQEDGAWGHGGSS